jgi:DNA-binding SARP family transcriptional activator/tetratricopeptide (TPR) repeat protein
MDIRLLGPFEAWHNGDRLDFGEGQQLYTLIALVLKANQPVSRTELEETIWAGQAKPKTSLVPGYVNKIRNVLKSAHVTDVALDTVHSHDYLLRVPPELLDTVRFTRLCEQARTAADKVALLREATGLWRGAFLQGVDIDRVGGTAVHTYDDARLDAIGDLAELELAAGDHRAARDRCWPEVRADPAQHRLAYLLMRALLANGDPVRAVDVYHNTQDELDKQYGLAPPEELRQLMWLAKRGVSRTRLPRLPIRFGGRATELDTILRLARSDTSVLWLHGMPGVGKTALAVAAAHRLRPDFPDGQVYVQLNGFTPNTEPVAAADALRTLLGELGVPAEQLPDGVGELITLYQEKLANTRTLVVLDNAISDAQIEDLLPTAEHCLAIVTSRQLPGLVGADVRVEPMTERDAIELFQALAGPERVAGATDLVADIVRLCGWLPMMITIVAAQFRRHRAWPLDHLVGLLHEVGLWQVDNGVGVAACTVSYRNLDPDQQSMFRLCARHPGPDFTTHAAAALMNCPTIRARGLLDGLHGVSLIDEIAAERYRLPDPLKQYAVHALPPETPDALDRLLDYYLVTTANATAVAFPFDRPGQPSVDRESPVSQRFPDQPSALEWLADERANLVAMTRHAAEHDRPGHAWRLAVLLWRYFYTTGHLRDWSQTLELARDATSGPLPDEARAHVLLRLSGARWSSGQHSQALELAAAAYPLWVRLGDARGEANTLSAIALVNMDLGNHKQAIEHFEAAGEKFAAIGDERGQANALSNLGNLNELRGELGLAEQQHLAAVGLLDRIGHTQGLAHALDNLGCVRQKLSRFAQAKVDHERARELAVQIGDRCVEAYALNNIGNVQRLVGQLDDAVISQGAARELADEVGDPNLRTQLYLDRAATSEARHEQKAARFAYNAALDLATGTGDRRQQAKARHGLARTLHEDGQHESAAAQWQAALTEFDALELPDANEITSELQAMTCACTAVQ